MCVGMCICIMYEYMHESETHQTKKIFWLKRIPAASPVYAASSPNFVRSDLRRNQ